MTGRKHTISVQLYCSQYNAQCTHTHPRFNGRCPAKPVIMVPWLLTRGANHEEICSKISI